jgi:hypothetical protein
MFDPLEPCPGATGNGCPHGSAIAPDRQLCHTCRRDSRRQRLEGVGTDPAFASQRQIVELRGFAEKSVLKAGRT